MGPDVTSNLDLFDTVPEEEEGPPPSGESSSEAAGASPEPGDAPDSPEPTVWTVSQVNQAVRALLEDTLPPLWVSGEVANWKRAGSGHCYFTIKDESAQLRCVMWRPDAARLPMDPEEGMRVRVFGQLTLYEVRGDVQHVVRKLEAEEGEGLWRLAFQRLRKKLDGEGLLAPERKRRLPPFPRTVGVVTSPSGAALHDILTVLRRRSPWLRVLIRGARVQGEGAAEEVARALGVLSRRGDVDVIIVGRGGGSLEDLWAFNEEIVARSIVASSVPVISAVGHEVDVTIADLVADHRAPTPSAAAEAVAPDREELLRYLEEVDVRLARGLRREVDRRKEAIRGAHRRLVRRGPRLTEGWRRQLRERTLTIQRLGRELTREERRLLREGRNALTRAIRGVLDARRHGLARLVGKMDALSPLSTLQRGYAVPLSSEGRLLRRVADFVPGEVFQLRVVDGRVYGETREVRTETEEVRRD